MNTVQKHTSSSKLGNCVSVSCVAASWPGAPAAVGACLGGVGGGPLSSVCAAAKADSSAPVCSEKRTLVSVDDMCPGCIWLHLSE